MADTWTAPTIDRTDPDRDAGERAALQQWLDFHRQTLLHKCSGLTADQLKHRSSPPSTLTLLGLVRHMTEVERWWFRTHADRQHDLTLVYDFEMTDRDFSDLDDADAAANLEAFREECRAADQAVAGHELDEVVPSHPSHPHRTRNIRCIYLHMIEEYARHNGHADLIREAIDGATGE
jgi:uncharacterized damage-inducible protein DinB